MKHGIMKLEVEVMKKFTMIAAVTALLTVPNAALAETLSSNDTYSKNTEYTIKNTYVTQMTDQITAGMQKRQPKINITYRGNFDNTKADLRQSIENVLQNDEYLAYDYRGYDAKWSGYDGKVTIELTMRYSQTYDQVQYVDRKAKEIVNQVTNSSMNNHEKVKAIHDYIVLNTAYDHVGMNQAINTPYHALTTGKTLCNGYAMLTYRMLQEVGIPTRLISGEAGQGADTIGHVWNLVQLDGKWYHLDTTWDDPIPDRKNEVSYDYYMLTDNMIRTDHFFKTGGLNNHDKPYPVATANYVDTIKQYPAVQRELGLNYLYANDASQLTSQIVAQLNRFENNFTVVFNGSQHAIANAMQQAVNQANHGKISYTISQTPRVPGHIIQVRAQYANDAQVSDVKISLPTNMQVGDGVPAKAHAVLSNGQSFAVHNEATYATSDARVATVENGVVIAKSTGKATITVNYRGVERKQVISVQSAPKRLFYPLQGIASVGEAMQVDPKKAWTFTFDEEVQAADVYVTTAYGERVAIQVIQQGNKVIVAPRNAYQSKMTYFAVIEATTSKEETPISYRFTIK